LSYDIYHGRLSTLDHVKRTPQSRAEVFGFSNGSFAVDTQSTGVRVLSPVLPGGFVGQPLQLDTSGTPGALFGIAATTDAQGHQIVYFNDDNTNAVMMLATP